MKYNFYLGMEYKNMNVIKIVETTLDCKLYDYQKELIKNMHTISGVPPHLIMPRRKTN